MWERVGGRIPGSAVLAGVLALAGLVVSASPSAAAKPPQFAASGTVQCTYRSLVFKITPGLTFTPTVQSTTFKGHAQCTGTTGNPAVMLRSATVTGALHYPSPQTCAALGIYPTLLVAPAEMSSLTTGASTAELVDGDVRWKAARGTIFDSHIAFDSYAFTGNAFSVPYPGGDAGTLTGSYGGEQFRSTATISRLSGTCGRKGIKTIHFGGSFSIQP